MARPPLPLDHQTVPVTECAPPLRPGIRIVPEFGSSHLDGTIWEVMGPNGSGWSVQNDFRPLGLLVLEGTNPLGKPVTWHPDPKDVRAEI